MTRSEYIKNNKYIQKSLKNLNKDDLDYLKFVGENNVKLSSEDLRLKQLIYHMAQGVKIWELKPLLQSFKILMTLNAG